MFLLLINIKLKKLLITQISKHSSNDHLFHRLDVKTTKRFKHFLYFHMKPRKSHKSLLELERGFSSQGELNTVPNLVTCSFQQGKLRNKVIKIKTI